MHIAITGASSGIGAALARELANVQGVRLTLVARRKPLLDQLAAELKVPMRVVPHDLSDPARAADWIAAAEETHGPIDVLVNNAGVQVVGPTASIDLAKAEEMLRGELRGTGVHVVTVYPGIIGETAMARAALEKYQTSKVVSAQPVGTAAGLARLIRAAIEKRQPRVIYPRVNTLARWFPAPTRWLLDRFTPAVRA